MYHEPAENSAHHVAPLVSDTSLHDMRNPVCYADAMQYGVVVIERNERLARDTYRLRFQFPQMAQRFLPGQFLMLRIHGRDDPLIGRAFALYDIVDDPAGNAVAVDIVYLVKGKLTGQLAQLAPGQKVAVWGPLGNGFPALEAKHVMMVAGGIGYTPFLAWAKELSGMRKFGQPPRTVPKVPRLTLCYGVRSADLLAGVHDFAQAGTQVRIATDDGSCGHAGLVTDLVRQALDQGERPHLVACGPERMMAAVAALAKQYDLPCRVSLETPMACGIGICFSCVARVRVGPSWDYRRTCVEGPVFEAQDIVW